MGAKVIIANAIIFVTSVANPRCLAIWKLTTFDLVQQELLNQLEYV
jgi:hypothetical protein